MFIVKTMKCHQMYTRKGRQIPPVTRSKLLLGDLLIRLSAVSALLRPNEGEYG